MAQIEVIDREKQRRERENTPEGKRAKRLRIGLGTAAAIIFFSVVYVLNHNPNAGNDTGTVTAQGVETVTDTTKAQSSHGSR